MGTQRIVSCLISEYSNGGRVYTLDWKLSEFYLDLALPAISCVALKTPHQTEEGKESLDSKKV